MTHYPDHVDATIGFVQAIDPMPDPLAGTDTETELRILLANLPDRQARRRPRLGRTVRIAVVAATAAAAAAVALVATTGSSPGSGGFVSQAQAAEIITQLAQKLTVHTPGAILETLTSTHETGPGLSLWSTYNTWESTTTPYNERVQAGGGGRPSYEQTTNAQGIEQVYDTAHNTIYEPERDYELKPGPRTGTYTLTIARAQVLVAGVRLPAKQRGTVQLTLTSRQAHELRTGEAEVLYTTNIVRGGRGIIQIDPMITSDEANAPTGTFENFVKKLKSRGTRVKLDGNSAIEIYVPSQSSTYWFSAKTLAPVKTVTRTTVDTNGSPAQGYDTDTTYYKTYRLLTSKAAQRLLSIQDAHPSAKIVVGALSYDAASKRLL